MQILMTTGAEIAFWDQGAGEPVLLVHASFGAEWFAPVADLLPGYRVVRTHRAGYGQSLDLSHQLGLEDLGLIDLSLVDLSLVDHARHLAEVLHFRGIEQAHVVGHSSGGSIALQLAASYPELVRSMVLLEPAFPYAPDEPRRDAMRNAIAAAKEGDLDRAFDFFPGSALSPGYRDVLTRALGKDGLKESVESGKYFFEREISALAGWDSDAAGLDALEQPTLLVAGGEGERLNTPHRARIRALASRMRNAKQASLEGVSHGMPLENPSLVAEVILAFIRQNPIP